MRLAEKTNNGLGLVSVWENQIGDKIENSERYALDKGEKSVNNVQTLNETFGRK